MAASACDGSRATRSRGPRWTSRRTAASASLSRRHSRCRVTGDGTSGARRPVTVARRRPGRPDADAGRGRHRRAGLARRRRWRGCRTRRPLVEPAASRRRSHAPRRLRARRPGPRPRGPGARRAWPPGDRLAPDTQADAVVRVAQLDVRRRACPQLRTSRAAGRACSPCSPVDSDPAPSRRRLPEAPCRAGRSGPGESWDCLPASAAAASRGDLVPVGTRPRPRPRRRTRPSTSGAGHSSDPVAEVGVEQVQRELGRQHGAAEVHEHDDAVAAVGGGDGAADRRRRRCRTVVVVEPGGDLDPRPARPCTISLGERDGGPRPGHGCARRRRCRPRGPSASGRSAERRARRPRRAASTEVAPGSWWPTLRSPR